MNEGKKRRKRYRVEVKRIGRQDRFTEMMEAVTGEGTRPCTSCGVVRPYSSLDASGTCTACHAALERARGYVADVKRVAEPGVVYVDASWQDGAAGLAVVGELGEHYQGTTASSSTHAEVLALRWAMDIARQRGLRDLTFRTDCSAALGQCWGTGRALGWKVEWVSRTRNQHADRLASEARHAL